MAVNLLMNLIYRGESVLFTSKNNKAVHAIADKVANALTGENSDADVYVGLAGRLVRFCADDTGAAMCSWQQEDLKDGYQALQALAERDEKVRFEGEQQGLDRALEDLGCVWRDLEARQIWTKRLEACEETIGNVGTTLALPAGKTVAFYRGRLERLGRERPKGGVARLLWWLGGMEQRQERLEVQLRKTFPEVRAAKRLLFIKRLTEELDKVEALARAKAKLEEAKTRVAQLPAYDTLSECAIQARMEGRKHQRDALLSRLYHRMKATQSVGNRTLLRMGLQLYRAFGNRLPASEMGALMEALRKEFKQEILTFNPAWVVTLLSLHRAAPCCAGIFDHVIIDEAAQCEVPPIIPALFRAKHVTIIGDPEQFPPVIDLPTPTHQLILRRNDLSEPGVQPEVIRSEYAWWDFRRQSAYSVTQKEGMLLSEHFRCTGDIAHYFNQTFYRGKLRMCSPNEARSRELLRLWQRRSAIDWVDVPNDLEREKWIVKETLDSLRNVRLNGRVPSVGVIVPAKKVADAIRGLLEPYREDYKEMLDLASHISTVNGFQGGERDVILLVLGVNASTPRGDFWYATDKSHAYIYNVAVSRAKLCCVVIGDRSFVANLSDCPPLKQLATYQPPKPVAPTVGPGERKLQEALERIGLHPETQYPVLNRRLDLAFPEKKLDVEVDGVKYHVNKYGDRKSDDIFRDEQLAIKGWETLRVWHYEITDDVNRVANRIKVKLDSMPSAS